MVSFNSFIVLESSAQMSSLRRFQKKKCKRLMSSERIHSSTVFQLIWAVMETTFQRLSMPGSFWTSSSYMTSSQVTKTFTSITPHRTELEPWARCHCVYLAMKHRLICSMTYQGHSSDQVIWPGLRSNFQIDLSGSKCIYSMRIDATNGTLRFSLSFSVQVICTKKSH